MKLRAGVGIAVGLGLICAASTSRAYNGTIQATLYFYQHQGGYCPTGRDCTGARYLQSEYHSNVPVRSAKFYVALWSDWNTILGTANTNYSGGLTINWYSPTVANPDVVLFTYGEHSTGRFYIIDDGPYYWLPSIAGPMSVTNGVTHNIGGLVWGTSPATANPYLNVYNAAYRMFSDGLFFSNHFVSYFYNTAIKVFHPFGSMTGNPCPNSSCAEGPNNTIHLIEGSEYDLNVMHEMGHIASYKAKPFTLAAAYCYPTKSLTCAGNWDIAQTTEWGPVAFEEGLAQFFKDAALYWPTATQPHTCDSEVACSQNVWHLDTQTAGTLCASNRRRWVLSASTYLRDIYDATNESASGIDASCPSCIYTDDVTKTYGTMVDSIVNTPSGTGVYQIDDPWNSSYTAIDATRWDARGSANFWYNFGVFSGVWTDEENVLNCTPP